MASTQVQLAERAAAAARSRYRTDMAPAAAPRQARRAGLAPGSAAPAAMPISDTTTSWFVMCFRFTGGPGSRFVSWEAKPATFSIVSSQHEGTWGSVQASQGLRWVDVDAKWEDCGELIAPRWARRTCHVGSRVEPTSGPGWSPGCLAGVGRSGIGA